MTDEEKKARAKQLGISVEELDEGVADGTLTFDDEAQPELPTPAAQEPETPEQPPVSATSYEEAKSGIVGKASGSRGNMAKGYIDAAEGQAGVYQQLGQQKAESIRRTAKNIRNASTAREIEANTITQQNIKANDTYRAAVDTANKAQMESNRDILKRYISDAELARKENEVMGKAERSATLWTGATELAAALANLIGVSRGAENQQIKLYSEDWMKRAEQNRKDRIRRLDSLNDRRSALEQQIAALQASGDKELAQVDLQNERYKNDREEQSSERRYNVGVALAGKDQEAEDAINEGNAKADLTKWGGVEKGSTAAFMPRGGGSSTTRTTPSRGYDEDGIEIVSSPKNGWVKENIGGKHYWFTPTSIRETIELNQNEFDLTEEEQAEFDAKKNFVEKLSYLKGKVNSHPKIQKIFREASFGRAMIGAPDETPAERRESADERLRNI